MHDTIQDWEYLIKNFNDVNTEVIIEKILLKPGIYILAIGYFEERTLLFTKVIENNKKINEKIEIVFDLKKKLT